MLYVELQRLNASCQHHRRSTGLNVGGSTVDRVNAIEGELQR